MMSKRKSISIGDRLPPNPNKRSIDDLLAPEPDPKVQRTVSPPPEPADLPEPRRKQGTPVRSHYYLSADVKQRVEVAHLHAKSNSHSRHTPSVSHFVEAALLFALREFDQRGADSELVVLMDAVLKERREDKD